MHHRQLAATTFISALILSASISVAQTKQPRRAPDVPYVPTTSEAVQAMLKLADVKTTDIVYGLGCGVGRIVIAAKEFGAHGVGIDINPQRVQKAKENAMKAGVERLIGRVTLAAGNSAAAPSGAKNPIMVQVTGRLPSLQGICSTTTPCSAHSTRRGA
jgi:SAM-dependent methyltransferase